MLLHVTRRWRRLIRMLVLMMLLMMLLLLLLMMLLVWMLRMRHRWLVVKIRGPWYWLLAARRVSVTLRSKRLPVGSKERRARRNPAGNGGHRDECGRARRGDWLKDTFLVHASTVLAFAPWRTLVATAANLLPNS